MPVSYTDIYDLLVFGGEESTFDPDDWDRTTEAVEDFQTGILDLIGVGPFSASDFNVTAVDDALQALVGSIGDQGIFTADDGTGRRKYALWGTVITATAAHGITQNATQYFYLRWDVSGKAWEVIVNQTGVAPTGGTLIATGVTNATEFTSINNAPGGRTNIIPLYGATYVDVSGDTMTGFLTLNADPSSALHAATKQYVDTQRDTRVAKAGDTMTGLLTLSGAPTVDLHAATKLYVDTGDAAANANANTRVLKAGDSLTGALAFTRAAAGDDIVTSRVSGDTQDRLIIDADGTHLWGGGSGAGDVNLYRSAADILKTDDTVHVGTSGVLLDPTGRISLGTTGGSVAIHIEKDATVNNSLRYNILVRDTTAVASGVGGGIAFGGKHNSGGSFSFWAGIHGAKKNVTDGNTAGELVFSTKANGGNLTEQMRINDVGDILITEGNNFILGTATGTKFGTATTEKLGFWNATPVVQGTVTGSRGGNAALASLLTLLASYGLVVDSSSA